MKCSLCRNKSKYEIDSCIINQTLRIISKKWVLPIILELLQKKKLGFNELQKELFPITPRILSKRLSELAKFGIIEKKLIMPMPTPSVEYTLAKKGRELINVTNEILNWAKKYNKNAKRCHQIDRLNKY
ncbi:MAG: helix-turn-helix domain-containing protein [archaeon]